MIQTSIYSYLDYKAYLKALIHNEPEPWGLMTKLAKAAGCQRPYLSRVLSDKAHLTPAQIYGLSRYWKLSPEETEYFLGLLELERASSTEYREYWSRKLSQARREHENLSARVKRNPAPSDQRDLIYYSSWVWTAIHVLVSIPEFQTERAISEKLALPPTQVKSVLETLEKWGSVRREKDRWKFGAREQHISKSSPLSVFHHMNWRNEAMFDAQKSESHGLHFTVVQSLSRNDYERIKNMILECIEKAQKIAGPSQEEVLMCFACDLFEVRA